MLFYVRRSFRLKLIYKYINMDNIIISIEQARTHYETMQLKQPEEITPEDVRSYKLF